MLAGLLISLFYFTGFWQMFKKMGREGWESIIPFYNVYVLFKVLYGEGWRFLSLFIPIYNIYVYVRLQCDLANAFGQPSGFALGLIFLNAIFMAILGFDNNIEFLEGETYHNDFVDDIIDSVSDKFEDFSNPESEEVSELKKLRILRDEETISEEEYDRKRKEVVNKL